MTKYTRVTGKVFGASADPTGGNPEIGQFGSALATTYLGTSDISTIQSLPAWSNGFIGCVTPNTQFPPLPEMTGFGKVLSQQICYLLQQGIAEYDSGTTYYDGNWCAYNKNLYTAKADGFSNVVPTDTTKWDKFTGGFSRNYGEIVTSSLPITDATLHLADGSLLNNTDYPELLSYINSIYSTIKDWTTPEDKLSYGSWTSIAYGNNKYIAINSGGYVATSTDADTWSSPTRKISGGYLKCIIYDGSKFITLDDVGVLTASSDGNIWNQIADLDNQNWEALIYANNLYIALGKTGYISTSSDGINWSTPTQQISSHIWKALAYDGNNYIALGTYGHISTSSDGSNWSTAIRPVNLYNTNFSWESLVYDGTQFIAFEDSGTVCTSTNGINWNTPQATILNDTTDWKSLINTTNGLVALSSSGYIGVQIDSPIAPFTTEENWQATYSTYGECGKYVYDSINNTVRIPLYNSYFTYTANSQILGNLTEASLPNIKATVSNLLLQDGTNYFDWQGAFYNAGIGGKSYRATNTTEIATDVDNIGFNANNYNSIYKDSATTVNTQSIKQLVYIVVGK